MDIFYCSNCNKYFVKPKKKKIYLDDFRFEYEIEKRCPYCKCDEIYRIDRDWYFSIVDKLRKCEWVQLIDEKKLVKFLNKKKRRVKK